MTLPVHHTTGPADSWGEPITAEFGDLFERMNRFLEAASAAPAPGAFSPMADPRETDDAYMVEAELPGIKREDIDVKISKRELHISGE
ncbi:MAG: Hsp20/alpha crystallin family protein [Streptomyces sp.]|nr:Hsp20/alpha crystallin family protein [Streptomyces sp.]NUS90093.1 Hsp20/alpha crystallin family protein [Streptomyces sp.]